jgi:hypothetical protein
MAIDEKLSGLAALDQRSREIFRRLVETYLETGEPVGSRTISRILPSNLSPASVRRRRSTQGLESSTAATGWRTH